MLESLCYSPFGRVMMLLRRIFISREKKAPIERIIWKVLRVMSGYAVCGVRDDDHDPGVSPRQSLFCLSPGGLSLLSLLFLLVAHALRSAGLSRDLTCLGSLVCRPCHHDLSLHETSGVGQILYKVYRQTCMRERGG